MRTLSLLGRDNIHILACSLASNKSLGGLAYGITLMAARADGADVSYYCGQFMTANETLPPRITLRLSHLVSLLFALIRTGSWWVSFPKI